MKSYRKIFRYFKKSAFIFCTFFADKSFAVDSYIKKSISLTGGNTYNVGFLLTDEGRKNVIPFGFQLGVMGDIKLSSEAESLDPNAKFSLLYQLAFETVAKMPQKAPALKSVNYDPIPKHTPIGNTSDASNPLSGVENLAQIASAIDTFQGHIENSAWSLAYKEYALLAVFFSEEKANSSSSYATLSSTFQALKNRMFLDGIMLIGGRDIPFKFRTGKDTFDGRILRHALNQCLIETNCNVESLMAYLILIDEFKPAAVRTFYQRFSTPEAVIKARPHDLLNLLQDEKSFQEYFDKLSTLDKGDREIEISNYMENLEAKIPPRWQASILNKYRILLISILESEGTS